MNEKIQATVDFIRSIYGTEGFIPLHEPIFQGNEKNYVNECIDSTFVSSVGKFVDQFEEKLSSFVGSKYAIALTNGTLGLHLALHVLGVETENEVITQSLSFVATANSILYTGASPIFLDVEEESLGLCPQKLEDFLKTKTERIQIDGQVGCRNKATGKIIKACIPVNVFGHAANLVELDRICLEYGITLVEDASESLGSYYKKRHTGTFGKVGVFSFNGNKIVTTGGGGALVTDDEAIAKKAKHLSTTAKRPHKWEYYHDSLAFNYRMPNINAALGVAQLEKIESYMQAKREVADKYKDFFSAMDIRFFSDRNADYRTNYWLNAIFLKSREERDQFLETLNEQGVMARPLWEPLHSLKFLEDYQRDELATTKQLVDKVINIPSSVPR